MTYESASEWVFTQVNQDRTITTPNDLLNSPDLTQKDTRFLGGFIRSNKYKGSLQQFIGDNQTYQEYLSTIENLQKRGNLITLRSTIRRGSLPQSYKSDLEDFIDNQQENIEEELLNELLEDIDALDDLQDLTQFNRRNTIVINNLSQNNQAIVRQARQERQQELQQEALIQKQNDNFAEFQRDFRKGNFGNFPYEDIENNELTETQRNILRRQLINEGIER